MRGYLGGEAHLPGGNGLLLSRDLTGAAIRLLCLPLRMLALALPLALEVAAAACHGAPLVGPRWGIGGSRRRWVFSSVPRRN
jgi:hypothetical protein